MLTATITSARHCFNVKRTSVKRDVPVHWWKLNLAGVSNGKMWCLKALYLQDILHVLSAERMWLQRSFTGDKGDKNKNEPDGHDDLLFTFAAPRGALEPLRELLRSATKPMSDVLFTMSMQHPWMLCQQPTLWACLRGRKWFSFFHFCPFSIQQQNNSSLHDVDVGVIREH